MYVLFASCPLVPFADRYTPQGIAPTLIIIQVGLGFSSDETTRGSVSHAGLSFAPKPGLSHGSTATNTSAPTTATRFGSEPDIMIATNQSNMEFAENPEKKEAFFVSAV
jgi:hypothetical protein